MTHSPYKRAMIKSLVLYVCNYYEAKCVRLSWDMARPRSYHRLACNFKGSGFRVQGSGFRVQGSGFRVQGSGFRA